MSCNFKYTNKLKFEYTNKQKFEFLLTPVYNVIKIICSQCINSIWYGSAILMCFDNSMHYAVENEFTVRTMSHSVAYINKE